MKNQWLASDCTGFHYRLGLIANCCGDQFWPQGNHAGRLWISMQGRRHLVPFMEINRFWSFRVNKYVKPLIYNHKVQVLIWMVTSMTFRLGLMFSFRTVTAPQLQSLLLKIWSLMKWTSFNFLFMNSCIINLCQIADWSLFCAVCWWSVQAVVLHHTSEATDLQLIPIKSSIIEYDCM